MDIGISMFATDYAMRPDDLAAACEARGFESIWFPEHTHIPASRLSPWPGGSELPKEYWHTHDLFVALMAAAGATKKIKIGSGICLVIERDPIVMAKEVATVDQLSNGRLIFGIGGGWNAEEMENHGTPFKKRWKVLRERIEAMKEIWANEEAEYHGEFTNFDKIWSYPKPAQKPHPPILLGTFNGGLKRVVNYCDGWIPTGFNPGMLPDSIKELQELAAQAGRPPVPVSVFGSSPKEEDLAKHRELGIERAVLMLPSADKDTLMPMLDDYATLIPKFAP